MLEVDHIFPVLDPGVSSAKSVEMHTSFAIIVIIVKVTRFQSED
jgi:hypothetical protein